MSDDRVLFEGYLGAFVRGKLKLEKLLVEFSSAIARDENSRQVIAALVEKSLKSGDLPTAAYRVLRRELKLPQGADESVTEMSTVVSKPVTMQPVAVDDDTDMIPLDEPDGRGTITDAHADAPGDLLFDEAPAQPPTALDDETVVAQDSTGNRTGPAAAGDETQVAEAGGTGTSSWDPSISGSAAGTQPSTWSDPKSWSGDGDEVLNVGSVIKDRFRLIEHIGKGGMGEVFKAIDQRKVEAQDRDPYVAVKVLNDEFKKHPKALQALQREARKTQELAHPNIMTVYDFDRQGSNVYMTMEFLDGEPMDVVIKKRKGEPFAEEEAQKIIAGMGEALAYAHRRGLVHSDFKPGNVFLRRDGTVKVLDFGIAARVSRPISDGEEDGQDKTVFDVKQFGAFTPAYASCEIMEGNEPDPRDDIYALACVAYQLLGGKHPFNRKRATFARDNGMKPEPIQNLTRAQMRGLQRGLAFTQADRTPTVEEFLDSIERKKSRVVPITLGAIAASVVLLIALSGPVVSYLEQRREEALIARFAGGTPQDVQAALDELAQIDDQNLRRRITGNAREYILAYYSDLAESSVDDADNKFDYPRAETLIEEARRLYPDSAQLERVNDQIASRKSRLLNELTTQFNAGIETGKLLPGEADAVPAVLAIVAQVNPDHPLLTDARLPPAYAREASSALARAELDRAEQLALAGLERFADDPALINLRDEIGAERTRQKEANEIEAIETQLRDVGRPTDLASLDTIRESLVRLQELRPEHELLVEYRRRTRNLLEPAVAGVLASRAWADGRQLLAAYEPLLPADFVSQSLTKFAEAESRFGKEVDRLFAEFESALAANRLAPPDQPNATELLRQLASTGGQDPRVERARARLGQSYLALARRARADGSFDAARRYVETGLSHAPGTQVSQSLNAETTEIARAEETGQRQLAAEEKAAVERERQERLATLYTSFESTLEALYSGDVVPTQAIDILDQVAAIHPTDPLLQEGRTRLAERIAAEATSLRGRNNIDQAIAVVQVGLESVPDSDTLSRQLAALTRDFQSAQAAERDSQIRDLRLAIEGALADPALDAGWEQQLRQDLQRLARLVPPDDPWRSEILGQVASLYLDQADNRLEGQRFAEARALLETGQRLSQDTGGFRDALAKLETAETAFKQASAERARQAEIEGLKQTLLTQAQANDVQAAVATLSRLRENLSADDAFLRNEAPEAIGEAYSKLARGFAEREQFTDALRLIEAGLNIAPRHAALRAARDRYASLATLQNLRDKLARATRPSGADVEALGGALQTLNDSDPTRAETSRAAFIDLFRTRIGALRGTDTAAAERWNSAGATLFPNAGFRRGDPVETAAVTPTPTTPARRPAPATRQAATPGKAAFASPRPCGTRIAGYGKDGRGTCFDLVAEKVRGPLMVVVPGDKPYAITKYEVTVKDYNAYCYLSKSCSPLSGEAALPVTGITYGEAAKYSAWLSEQTGISYRLPTETEWTYAAKADGSNSDRGKYNCLLKQGSNILRGGKLLPVNAGAANSWGLVHSVGNAQEWVGDGSVVIGGAYHDAMSACDTTLKRNHDGTADEFTSFRLVRDVSDS